MKSRESATRPGDEVRRTVAVDSASRRNVAPQRLVADRACLQVRLRFVVVLAATFLVVGLWGDLRNIWDTWRHRLAGSHAGQQAVSIDTEYFCPMCPGVVSDWPAICPVCSMDLVRRKKGRCGAVARRGRGADAIVPLSNPACRDRHVTCRKSSSGPRDHCGWKADRFPGRWSLLPRDPTAMPAPTMRPPDLHCSVAVSVHDVSLLSPGRQAQVALEDAGSAAVLAGRVEFAGPASDAAPGRHNAIVRIRLSDSTAWARPGMYGTARIAVPLSEIEPFASLTKASKQDSAAGFTSVPETAVVDTGSRRVVFVETMPGMFDGVEVTLGPRCGDYYPVIQGLAAGQKVATTGAFLIDAECD